MLDKDNLIKLKYATNEQEIVDLLNEYLTKEKEVVQSQGKKVIGITACTVLQNSDEPFILGSKTQDINDFKNVINTNLVENYLNKINLNNNDFVYINAGMIHGLPGNLMVFELQQSSDITYWSYDYDRLDINVKKEIFI
ncbi:hypothetical protein RRG55_04405 [Mycoplasmopsis felis]|uniref:hypothetical protein n=1 Tax=Mycoplasmopsis felis TaxID=33923 RepID=UPI002AFF94AB|nr:hypothetical protein [Mycoplasmopsis felis]WQQ03737.1 hypothetical protein RRG47_02795 [Mycoplasmopsis felis]